MCGVRQRVGRLAAGLKGCKAGHVSGCKQTGYHCLLELEQQKERLRGWGCTLLCGWLLLLLRNRQLRGGACFVFFEEWVGY